MQETWRHPELRPIVRREFDRQVSTISRRATADVDGDVEDRPARDPDELSLGARRFLLVEAANGSLRWGYRMIVLHQRHLACMRAEKVAPERLREEPARIAEASRDNEKRSKDSKPREIHLQRLMGRTGAGQRQPEGDPRAASGAPVLDAVTRNV